MKIAIAGNPNCGKTTIFNALTGSHQHVGNYPGVTVEKKSGSLKVGKFNCEVVDLPGTYGLSAYSEDEIVARNYILNERPDLIINVVDASNLERSLNLTLQLIEIGVPMVLVVNMIDVAERRGYTIDGYKLSQVVGLPVASTVGRKGAGLDNVLRKAEEVLESKETPKLQFSYSHEIDEAIINIRELLLKARYNEHLCFKNLSSRWLALKLTEQDADLTELLKKANKQETEEILKAVSELEAHINSTNDDTLENVISDYRYGTINSICKQATEYSRAKRRDLSDKIDTVITHKVLGPVILLAILWYTYQVTFSLSEYPVAWLESMFGFLHDFASSNMADGLLKSIVVSALIDGVGGVLGFVPLIILMFAIIAIIEDSGYMARIAFLLDRVLRFFGLHGNSILSYIISGGIIGGCAVPGVMAARTLRDPKERLATILTVPFMNCGAKLPVYALLIAAFFPANKGAMMFALTIGAWAITLVMAATLRLTLLKGEPTPFIMELPPYRLPTVKSILIHTWQRGWMYIKKAGTIILAATIIMWALMTFPVLDPAKIESTDQNVISARQLEYSVAGRVGKAMETVTMPLMGFDWKVGIALIAGASAKELIVSTLGTALSLGEVDVEDTAVLSKSIGSAKGWSPLLAITLMIFTMLYMPCLATLAAIKSETKSWKVTIFSAVYTTAVASLFATGVYQVGSLLL